MQKTSDAGFEAGVIAGYRLTNHWSLEAGLVSSRRHYYSDGKYLNTSKIYLPPNSSITMVDGSCRMLEIPVSIRFNGAARKHGNWFGTAGLSSYLMKREDYDYAYYYPSTNYTAIHSKTYRNESRDWVSVLQLSGGYDRSVTRTLNVRVEPYLQLPLRGMGFGKLPLTSAGVRIGFTKSLF
ncbi:MAG: PorT family protein [Flaviaesturariibacter sp.]|nr:PorT family protein [Flaviaesturariibacter sp.]